MIWNIKVYKRTRSNPRIVSNCYPPTYRGVRANRNMIADRRIPRLFAMFNYADCDALEKRHIPSNDSIRIYSYHPWMNEANTPPPLF